MNDLIDTPEMYLRTILELHEEGIEPLRARIVERLHQSGPTVSQTVARLERDGRASVGLEALEPHHPFVNLRPCDNIFAVETDWYRTNPLILQGPGAGREVTAAAVQADLWAICAEL